MTTICSFYKQDVTSTAWIGLGGNIGHVRQNMAYALRRLEFAEAVSISAVSSLYRTPPWGKTDQPWFLNAAAILVTRLEARQFLDFCLMIEQECQRKRQERWGPRTLDIDLLFFANNSTQQTLFENDADLTLPHPRIKERAFVLLPLAEIAPTLVIDGKTVSEWAQTLPHHDIEKIPLPANWWQMEEKVLS